MEYFPGIVQKHRTTKPTYIPLVQEILYRKEESVVCVINWIIDLGIERFQRPASISFIEM